MKRFGKKDVTFGNSKETPFQRWYPYIEGYSPSFVEDIIENYCANASLIYEPFAGTGTTLFASDTKNKNTIYSEVNPVLVFLIQCKISVMRMDDEKRLLLAEQLRTCSEIIIKRLERIKPSERLAKSYDKVFGNSVYFSSQEYNTILKLRKLIDLEYRKENIVLGNLLTVAVLSCLLPVSFLKKQGDVRFKTEQEKQKDTRSMAEVLPGKIAEIAEDVADCHYKLKCSHSLITTNAKKIGSIDLDSKISAVITSPPYLNGTNYFRNTKLELWFLGFLNNEKDLRVFRDEALTSGINDVKREYNNDVLCFNSSILDETLTELNRKAYDSRIPLMAKCYFQEMYQLFEGLKKHLEKGADILIDLGDSIFSGVHIKTDLILIQILEQLGYTFIERVILRKRISRNGSPLSQVLLVLKYN